MGPDGFFWHSGFDEGLTDTHNVYVALLGPNGEIQWEMFDPKTKREKHVLSKDEPWL